MGNLTREPTLTQLPSGTPVVDFGIATNKKFKTADGQAKEEVMFVDVHAFAKTADAIAQYCHKGDPLLIEGELKFDQWTDQSGNKRSKHKVQAYSFTFVGNKSESQPATQPTTTDTPDDMEF